MERNTMREAFQQPKLLPAAPVSSSYAKVLYTPEEAAELLSMSRTLIYSLLARSVIASIKEGRARLIPAAALEQYVQRRLEEQTTAVMGAAPLAMFSSSRKGV